MPRKNTREIKIRHLKCFGAIWEELSGHPGLAGYEITEAVIRVQERVRPTINNVEAVIERIRFSHATRKYRYPAILGREMIGQSVLAKMAGVSRQTIARWEELGFISRSDIGIPGEKYFVIEEVISQLGKLKGVK